MNKLWLILYNLSYINKNGGKESLKNTSGFLKDTTPAKFTEEQW